MASFRRRWVTKAKTGSLKAIIPKKRKKGQMLDMSVTVNGEVGNKIRFPVGWESRRISPRYLIACDPC